MRRIAWRAREHEALPRVVRFSGGRSSAAMTFLLAESGLLRPERGDVVLFANTTAEHPGTYAFARECKRRLERDFGLPVLWYEFCTVEDASRGMYVRQASYRLVRADPVEDDPRGYRSHGEAFEEMLSWNGMLPNPHTRSCTAKLKLYPAHELLAEWFGTGEGPRHAGHYADCAFVRPEQALEAHRRSGGVQEESAYLRRAVCMTERPPSRPAQRWRDYTDAPPPPRPHGPPGPAPLWGADATEYIALLGLRADEPKRIDRIAMRSFLAEGAGGRACSIRTQPPGERPYFPLEEWGFDKAAVEAFWRERDFDLDIPEDAGNCVFCFMKGTNTLARLASCPDPARVPGAPSDAEWWAVMERRYRRESLSGGGFGFLGLSGPSFDRIAAGDAPARNRYATGEISCDCTD